MAEGVFTPYSSLSRFFGTLPGWVPPEDQERIESYAIYEQIYWNQPETFSLVVRGTDTKPVYVPSGRIIVDTTNRYVGSKLKIVPDPLLGSDNDRSLLMQWWSTFLRRERFLAQYNSAKRYGIIRGDWLFHVYADPAKPAGSRVSIKAIDPASYFPVFADDNLDKIIRVHIAEEFLHSDGKTYVKRQTYDKDPVTGLIISSSGLFEVDKWFNEGQAASIVLRPPVVLDPRITQIPVYHIKNFEEPQNPFGSSELRGIETVIAAVNQTVSDEDLTLALDGIGVYATDGGGPVDDLGNPSDWVIGPGRVIENAANFRRVSGAGNIQPYSAHIDTLMGFLKEASGTPDAAIGKVDVSVAESGISLLLQLGPMLAKAEEKDQLIVDTLTQLFYDISTMWFPVYEGANFNGATMIPVLGDKLPTNRQAVIDEIVALMATDPPLISAETGRRMLVDRLGYQIDLAAEAAAVEGQGVAESADPVGDRLVAEAQSEDGVPES